MENIELIIKVLGLLTVMIAILQYRKNRKLQAHDKFIKYREKLKENESISKIVSHIQDWQSDLDLKKRIDEREIKKSDFYYFLGFFEEIEILRKGRFLTNKMAKDMFAFYALELADNQFYWEYFDEDYLTDDDWVNFRNFIYKMRELDRKKLLF